MKTTSEIPLDWLVCPITRGQLTQKDGKLHSSASIYIFNPDFGFWNFVPDNLEEFDRQIWKVWNALQENGLASYINDPARNLGVGKRQDYIDFGNFCEYKGLVLDIGVGPQKIPTHIEHFLSADFDFIGIDPLVGEQPRQFKFVQALGEYLPFRGELFDQVLFVTSLDHFVDPKAALIEAKRVLKSSGEICVWLGEKDKNAPRPKESPEWYKKLQIPAGAEDPFHYKRFSSTEFEGYLQQSKLKIKTKEEHKVDQWRKNLFYKLGKL